MPVRWDNTRTLEKEKQVGLRHDSGYPSETRSCCEGIVPCVKAVASPVVRVGVPVKCRKSGDRNGHPRPGLGSRPSDWKALKESHRASISCFARFCRSTCASRPGSRSVAPLGSHLGLDPSCCFASCCGRRRLFGRLALASLNLFNKCLRDFCRNSCLPAKTRLWLQLIR